MTDKHKKCRCPCGSGAAVQFTMHRMAGSTSKVPAIRGYDGPATVVSVRRLETTGAPVVLVKCGACGKVPMFRGESFVWVAIEDMTPEELSFYIPTDTPASAS